MRRLLASLAGAAIAGAVIASSTAQPPAPTAGAPAPAREPEDAAALRARFERRLAECRQTAVRFEEAIKRLDRGESPDSVRDSVEPWRRSRPPGPGGPNGADRPERGAPPPVELPDRAAILEFLGKHNPDMLRRVQDLEKENPQAAERTLGRMAPHIREVLAERDPQTRGLRLKDMQAGWEAMGAMRRLIDALRKDAAGAEAREAEKAAETALGTHFAAQVALRNREIAVLEERIAQIRGELQEKLAEQDSYISQRLQFAHDRAKHPPRERRERDGGRGERPDGPKPEATPAAEPKR